jgi:hypothetical protein
VIIERLFYIAARALLRATRNPDGGSEPVSPSLHAAQNGSEGDRNVTLANILWAVVVILVVLWLIGLVGNIGGGLVWLLLVIAAVIVVYNLLVGRSSV